MLCMTSAERDSSNEGLASVRHTTCQGPRLLWGIGPGSYRDIRASLALIAWQAERPCARTKDSPRLMRWIELSGQRHVQPALLREPRKRNANGKERRSARSTQSTASKTTTQTRQFKSAGRWRSMNSSRGRTKKALWVPGSLPVMVSFSAGYLPPVLREACLQWPISAPMYGESDPSVLLLWGGTEGRVARLLNPFPPIPVIIHRTSTSL